MELKTEMIGKVIEGKYHIQEVIGSGAYGVVFRAEQKIFDIFVRQVAMKIINETSISWNNAQQIFADAICLARALEESKDSEGKRYLVRVFDMGILDKFEGRGYIVMEFIQNKTTLGDFIRSRKKYFLRSGLSKKDVPKGLEIAKQICKGLRVLHSLDEAVIHRDLKPENILLTADEEVRIVDFGLSVKISKIMGFKSGVAGTIPYMAPETLLGQSNCASDVYSVGLILYKMFTGKHPFEQIIDPPVVSDKEKLQYHYETRKGLFIIPPSRLNNTVDEGIETVIMQCLNFDSNSRYQSAKELLSALEDLEKGTEKRKEIRIDAEKLIRKKSIFTRTKNLREAEKKLLESIGKDSNRKDVERFMEFWDLGKLYLNLVGKEKEKVDYAISYLKKAEQLDEQSGFLHNKLERAELKGDIAMACKIKGLATYKRYVKEYELLTGNKFDNYKLNL
jgi:serine/threonine protein kinase